MVDIFSYTPVSQCSTFQNLDTKSLSLSETISVGNLFSQYHSLKKRDAKCSAVISVCVGMILISLPKQSVNVTIQFFPSSSGKGPIKLIATESLH